MRVDQVTTEARIDILTEIWRAVLERPSLGRDDDLFEVGGSSLQALEIAARIFSQFGVEVTLRNVFQRGTPRQMSEFLTRQT